MRSRVSSMAWMAWMALTALSAGCGAATERTPESSAGAQGVGSRPREAMEASSPVPAIGDLTRGGESNGGVYTVRYRTLPDPIVENQPFAIEVRVLHTGDSPNPAAEVSLAADAAMPQHNHGMIQAPEVRAHGDGSFTVSGMLFHMIGEWELYLDITQGAMTERAQFDVELD